MKAFLEIIELEDIITASYIDEEYDHTSCTGGDVNWGCSVDLDQVS